MSIEKYEDKESFLQAFKDRYAKEFLPEGWDDKVQKRVVEITKPSRTKSGIFSSIPMKCYAEKCVFADTCPLQKENIAPKGYPCPLEMAMVLQFADDYMKQLGIDEENFVEVSMVRNIVNYEVQFVRTSKYLAKEGFIQENVVGVNPNGEVIMRKELHTAVEMQDKVQKAMKELRKELMATREAKAKLGMGTLDTAQAMANLMSEVGKLQAQQDKIHLQKLGLANHDSYIHDAEIVDEDETDE